MRGLKEPALRFFRQLVRHGMSVADEPDRRKAYIESRQSTILSEMAAVRATIRETMPDNPALNGFKVYSQVDEDGIIQELLRRLPSSSRNHTAIEIGCGDGTENNTHFLLLNGFRAVWVDGNPKNIAFIRKSLGMEEDKAGRLMVLSRFVGTNNITDIVDKACAYLGNSDPDLFSLDIDGNDLHVLGKALESVRPKIICAEYNAKFPPPMTISINYDQHHTWVMDDYQGASLQAFCDLLGDYSLVCCNSCGSNAFFVRNDLRDYYTIYPVAALYRPLHTEFRLLTSGHPPSLKWLRNALS